MAAKRLKDRKLEGKIRGSACFILESAEAEVVSCADQETMGEFT
jgi:hypothetical protein